MNPKFTRMTGYESDEVVGKDPSVLKAGEKTSEEYEILWKTITSGQEWRGEFHNRRKDGQLYWDHSTISPVTDKAGKITHFVAVKEDISERKESEHMQGAVLCISAALAGCQTEDELCRTVVEGVRNEMGIDRCGLFLGDTENPVFRGTYGTNLHGETTKEENREHNLHKLKELKPLLDGVPFVRGLPLAAPDAMPGEENIRSALIALRQRGKVFGVMSVDNRISKRPITNGSYPGRVEAVDGKDSGSQQRTARL